MQLKKLLEKWDPTSLKITTPVLEMEWPPMDEDKDAAWKLYIELIARVSTLQLAPSQNNEAAALKSIYEFFDQIWTTIKNNGRYCINFTRIVIVVLNQKFRSITAAWHPDLEEA